PSPFITRPYARFALVACPVLHRALESGKSGLVITGGAASSGRISFRSKDWHAPIIEPSDGTAQASTSRGVLNPFGLGGRLLHNLRRARCQIHHSFRFPPAARDAVEDQSTSQREKCEQHETRSEH